MEYPYRAEHKKKRFFFTKKYSSRFFLWISVSGILFHPGIWHSNCVHRFSQLEMHTERTKFFKAIAGLLES